MKINQIHIDAFGKFENYDLSFSDGLNVIYGQNEDGKSTIMSFILMMFYGYSGKSRDLLKNPREKYRPWNGSEMKGSILFEYQSNQFRLERTFGKSNSSDKINIINSITGEPFNLPSKATPGQAIFGLGEEAFIKSVFISQGGILVDATGKNDEITEKLLNLVTTGNEDVSYKKAVQSLNSSIERLVSKSKRQGLLVEDRTRLVELKDELIQAQQDESDKLEASETIERLNKQLKEKQNEYQQYQEKRKVIELDNEKEKIENSLRQKEYFENAQRDLESQKELLKTSEGYVDDEVINQLKKQLADHEKLVSEEKSKLSQLNLLRQEYQQILEAKGPKITEETVDQVQKNNKNLDNLKRQKEIIEDIRNNLQKVVDTQHKVDRLINDVLNQQTEDLAKKDLAIQNLSNQIEQVEESLNKLKTDYKLQEKTVEYAKEKMNEAISTGNARLVDAKKDIEEAKQPKVFTEEIPASTQINKGLLVVSILFGVVAIVLGYLINPYLYLLLVAAVLIGVLSFKKQPARTKTFEDISKQAIEQSERQLAQVQQEINAINEQNKLKVHNELRELEVLDSKLSENQVVYDDMKNELKIIQVQQQQLQLDKDTSNQTLVGYRSAIKSIKDIIDERQSDLQDNSNSEKIVTVDQAVKQLDRIQSEMNRLNNANSSVLAMYEIMTFDDLVKLQHESAEYQRRLQDKQLKIDQDFIAYETLSKETSESEKSLLERLSIIDKVEDLAAAHALIEATQKALEEYKNKNTTVKALTSALTSIEKTTTTEQFSEQIQEIESKLATLLNNESYSKKDIETLINDHEGINELDYSIKELRDDITRRETELREKYRHRRNISQVKDDLDALQIRVAQREHVYEGLLLAKNQLESSFQELQRSFGPKVNEKTEAIFSRLTQGKYERVRVNKDFSISFEDPNRKSNYEWGFLSGGTIDQAYLSLRLAISDLVTQDHHQLPLLLDDIFTQYDDHRAYAGMKFLEEYVHRNGDVTQAILFTCHRRLFEWGSELGGTNTLELTQR